MRDGKDRAAAPREAPGKWLSFGLTLAVHLGLFLFLFFGIRWQSAPPAALEVSLASAPRVAAPAPVAEPRPAPPPEPRPAPAPEPKPEPKPEPPPPPKPEPKPQPRPEPKPEPPKPAPVPKPEIATKAPEKKHSVQKPPKSLGKVHSVG